jgi:hypothetical protein
MGGYAIMELLLIPEFHTGTYQYAYIHLSFSIFLTMYLCFVKFPFRAMMTNICFILFNDKYINLFVLIKLNLFYLFMFYQNTSQYKDSENRLKCGRLEVSGNVNNSPKLNPLWKLKLVRIRPAFSSAVPSLALHTGVKIIQIQILPQIWS